MQPTLPQTLFFYDGKFFLRPVPDQPYRVQMEVYKRPTELLQSGQNPELNEWWQYIAYGAAKKIFEDRMDLESVQMILPEYKKQEALILRRTIVQQTSQRTSTIYEQESNACECLWVWLVRWWRTVLTKEKKWLIIPIFRRQLTR